MRRALAVALLAASLLLSPLLSQAALAATLPLNHALFVTQVITLVNVERQRAGLSPLTANGPLTRMAQDYAAVMADTNCFSHTCGSTFADRVNRSGYTNWIAVGENLTQGQITPEQAMAAWMGSAGHRGNILNPVYRDIGVGLALNALGQFVWVQEFGASTNPVVTTLPAICTPRPAFSVRSRPTAPGVLEITVTAGTSVGAPTNTLKAVKFGSVVNGVVDIAGYGRVTSGTTVGIVPGTQGVTIVVQRASRTATTVPLILTDACGDWRTFVGAGANVP